jgi:hypothetical protein
MVTVSHTGTGGKRLRAAGILLPVLVLVLSMGARVVRAADPKQDAKARYTSGQSHYNLSEFQEALQDFKEAYRLFPDPVFLFNAAQCERQLGSPDEAIKFYRSYLRNKPDAANRREVLRRIDEMQAALAAEKSTVDEPPRSLSPPEVAEQGADRAVAAEVSRPLAIGSPTPAPTVSPALSPTPAPAVSPTVSPALSSTPAPAVSPAVSPALSPALAAPAPLPAATTESDAKVRVDLVAHATPGSPAPPPAFYHRWWFWTAAAIVIVSTSVGIYAASARGGNSAPAADLGIKPAF